METESEIKWMNSETRNLDLNSRIEWFYQHFDTKDVLVTSSFGIHSVLLLYLISRIKHEQMIHFIDTGNHFRETLDYRDLISNQFGLQVETVTASEAVHNYTIMNQTWKTSPEFCCHLKKVRVIHELKNNYKVWMTGLMEWQSDHRASLDFFEYRKGILKFHPLLDQSEENFQNWVNTYNLPVNKLLHQGYSSVGCTHCTIPGEKRNGRWMGSEKTECGLHL